MATLTLREAGAEEVAHEEKLEGAALQAIEQGVLVEVLTSLAPDERSRLLSASVEIRLSVRTAEPKPQETQQAT